MGGGGGAGTDGGGGGRDGGGRGGNVSPAPGGRGYTWSGVRGDQRSVDRGTGLRGVGST